MKNNIMYVGKVKDTFSKNAQYKKFDFGFESVDWSTVSSMSEKTLKDGFAVKDFSEILNYVSLTPINNLHGISIKSIAIKSDLSGFYIVTDKSVDMSSLVADFKSYIINSFIKKTFKEVALEDILDSKCYEMLMNKQEEKSIFSKIKDVFIKNNIYEEVLNIFQDYLIIKDSLDERFHKQKFIKSDNIKKLTEILTINVNALPIFEMNSSNIGFTVNNKKKDWLVERFEECFPSPLYVLNKENRVDILLKLSKSTAFSDEMLLSTLNVLSANGNYKAAAFDFYKKSKKDNISKKIVASLFILDDSFSASYMTGILACGAIPEFLKMSKIYEDLVKKHGSEKSLDVVSLSEGKTFKNKDTLLYLATFINGFAPYNAVKKSLNELAGKNAYWNKEKQDNKKCVTVSIDLEKLNLSFLSLDAEIINKSPDRSSHNLNISSFLSFIQGSLSNLCELNIDIKSVKSNNYSIKMKDDKPLLELNRNAQFLISDEFVNNPLLVRAIEMSMKALESDFTKNIKNGISDEQMINRATLMLDLAMNKILVEDTIASVESTQEVNIGVTNNETNEFKI